LSEVDIDVFVYCHNSDSFQPSKPSTFVS